MKRSARLGVVALQIAVAGLALLGLAAFWLGHMLVPWRAVTIDALYAAVAVIVIATGGVAWAAVRPVVSGPFVAIAIATTGLAGFAPWIIDTILEQQEALERLAEDRRFEQDFLNDLHAREADIAGRRAERRAFTPQEALDLLIVVESSDLSYRGRGDHWDAAFALLQQALSASLVDPNGLLEGAEFRKFQGKPLFLYYYEVWMIAGNARKPTPRQWQVTDFLVRSGADLTRADAKPLAAEIAARRSSQR
jgi:hypothetical protein